MLTTHPLRRSLRRPERDDAMATIDETTTDATPTTDGGPKAEPASNWAQPVGRLSVDAAPKGSIAATVEGRRLAGPLQGFGQLWQKTYRVRLDRSLEPAKVVAEWKAHFSEFWPEGNTFYAPLAGIRPGEVALLKVSTGGPVKLHSGVMVIYADDVSFALMTPEGHALAAWITFSAERDAETGAVIAQAQALERTSDPINEIAYAFGAGRMNDRFWERTLEAFARHFGTDARCETTIVKVDSKRQWRYARNVVNNASIRGTLWIVSHPRSWLRR